MARHALATLLAAAALSGARAAHDDPPTDGHDNKWYPQNYSATTCKQNVEGLTSIAWIRSGTRGFGTGLVTDTQEGLEDCCAEYYAQGATDAFETCVEKGGGNVDDADVSTNTWRVDWTAQIGGRCVQDCAAGGANDAAGECGGAVGGQAVSGVTHHASAADCCDAHFGHVKQAYCVAVAEKTLPFTGTGNFYIDSTRLTCSQDCPTSNGGDCGGVVIEDWINTDYTSLATCCAATNVPDYCNGQADGKGGTNKWFVDGNVCKLDCLTGATGKECSGKASGWTKFFDTAEGCCSGGLGWVQSDWCITRSQPETTLVSYGTFPGFTQKWAVDYQNHICVQDCDTTGNPACGKVDPHGPPNQLFSTAADCCAEKLGYRGEACEPASIAGGTANSDGTGKWYADYASARRCVLDCKTSDGTACGGVVANIAGVSFYDTAEECCSEKYGWYYQPLCKAISEGAGEGHTDHYYANYQTGTCEQDCKTGTVSLSTGTGFLCKGNPTDMGMPQYETIDECCETKLGWTAERCITRTNNILLLGADAADKGTGKWIVHWQDATCYKDCKEGDADFDETGGENYCGGVATDLSLTGYDTLEECCTLHSWVDPDLCVAFGTKTYTNKFYYDFQEKVCHQDCDASSADPCKGHPTDKSMDLFDTAENCCIAKLSQDGNKDECMQVPLALQGDDSWYIATDPTQCVKNCPTGQGDDECGGLAPGWLSANQFFASAADCCDQPTFNYFPGFDPDEGLGGCAKGY